MRILVIEDENDVRLNILEILSSGGFDSIDAENGFVGIQFAKEKCPDLILCDIKMPDLDGYEVLQSLRQDPSTAMIPFIFLTAKTEKADIRQGMNLGADDYLTKPFRRKELLDTIAARLKRHHAQLEVQKKVEELQEINTQKDDLVSTITHDLKAPLATIKIALQLIQDMPENRKQYIEIARNACDQGDELIQNLLDLYQLESGESLASPEPIDLQEHLGRIADLFQVRSRDRQQILLLDVPETLPKIMVDGVSLKRIIVELLNNACKYTQSHQQISLKVRVLADTETPILRFTVANQAEIAAIALPRIFDKFYQVPSGSAGKQSSRLQRSGTGLGLALVKKLVQQLKATIEVSSEAGWTTFTIDLPYESL
jgi:two-component system, sensor histidine kinase and response regulator